MGGNSVASQWHSALQLAVAYYAAVLWFNDGLLGVWKDTLRHEYLVISDFLLEKKIIPNEEVGERWPAVMAVAGWHTAVIIAGLVTGNTLKRMRVWVGMLLWMAISALAATCMFFVLQESYESNEGGMLALAKAMYWPTDIEDSSFYFSALGSGTMLVWYWVAILLATMDPEDEGLASAVVARYLPRIVGFYILSLVFFRFGCVPLWNTFGEYSPLSSTLHAEANLSGSISSLTKLASVTHTLVLVMGCVCCSITNSIIRKMPCSPQGVKSRIAVSNIMVLAMLCLTFIAIFAQWVLFALANDVSHVVEFAKSFVKADAVQATSDGNWSEVHTLVLFSYTTWFAGGVLFEQAWSGSATNEVPTSTAGPQAGMSLASFAITLILIALPIAWRGGALGAVGLVILLWPQAALANHEKYKWGKAAQKDAFKQCSFDKAAADCPRTGDQYLIIGVGFVGIKLVEKLLARGETKIRCFDIVPKNPFENNPNVQYIRGDVTKMDDLQSACKGVQTVITTFAVIRFWERLNYQAALNYKINTEGTRNVIKACKDQKVKFLVQTSTSNVMATPIYNKPGMDEESPLVTRETCHNHYGWTKALAETAVREANCKEMKTVAIRPCSGVFGVNDKNAIDRFLTNRCMAVTFPRDRIDWVFVENVVLGLLKGEARLQDGTPGVAGEAFNITNGQILSYWELAEGFHHYYNNWSYVMMRCPDLFLKVLARIVEFITWATKGRVTGALLGIDFLTPATLITAAMEFSCTSEKARKRLNYVPAYTIEEGLQKCAAILRGEYVESKQE